MDQDAGDAFQASGVPDHGALLDKSRMGEIVRAEPDEREHVVARRITVGNRRRVRLPQRIPMLVRFSAVGRAEPPSYRRRSLTR